LNCLNFVRELKELGVGVIFENINTDTPRCPKTEDFRGV